MVSVELDERFHADHRDVRTFRYVGPRPDLVWASPPCTEFSRSSMPWTRARMEGAPSLDLVHEAMRVVHEANPRYWCLENVRGAVPWLRPVLGPWRERCGPFFLWGDFPALHVPRMHARYKQRCGGDRADLRAEVPASLSLAMLRAIEHGAYQLPLIP